MFRSHLGCRATHLGTCRLGIGGMYTTTTREPTSRPSPGFDSPRFLNLAPDISPFGARPDEMQSTSPPMRPGGEVPLSRHMHATPVIIYTHPLLRRNPACSHAPSLDHLYLTTSSPAAATLSQRLTSPFRHKPAVVVCPRYFSPRRHVSRPGSQKQSRLEHVF